jgi:hypothetical protein
MGREAGRTSARRWAGQESNLPSRCAPPGVLPIPDDCPDARPRARGGLYIQSASAARRCRGWQAARASRSQRGSRTRSPHPGTNVDGVCAARVDTTCGSFRRAARARASALDGRDSPGRRHRAARPHARPATRGLARNSPAKSSRVRLDSYASRRLDSYASRRRERLRRLRILSRNRALHWFDGEAPLVLPDLHPRLLSTKVFERIRAPSGGTRHPEGMNVSCEIDEPGSVRESSLWDDAMGPILSCCRVTSTYRSLRTPK